MASLPGAKAQASPMRRFHLGHILLPTGVSGVAMVLAGFGLMLAGGPTKIVTAIDLIGALTLVLVLCATGLMGSTTQSTTKADPGC